MRPLTDTVPKALIPVCGRPLLDYIIEGLLQSGFKRVVFVVEHHRERIVKHVLSRFADADPVFVRQDRPLGIADAFMRVVKQVESDFLAIHSDNLFVPEVFSALRRRHGFGSATMAVVPYRGESPRNRSFLDPVTSRLSPGSGIEPLRNTIDVQTTGCSVFPMELFDYIERTMSHDPSCDVYSVLCEHRDRIQINGVFFEGVWGNINTVEDLKRIEARLGCSD